MKSLIFLDRCNFKRWFMRVENIIMIGIIIAIVIPALCWKGCVSFASADFSYSIVSIIWIVVIVFLDVLSRGYFIHSKNQINYIKLIPIKEKHLLFYGFLNGRRYILIAYLCCSFYWTIQYAEKSLLYCIQYIFITVVVACMSYAASLVLGVLSSNPISNKILFFLILILGIMFYVGTRFPIIKRVLQITPSFMAIIFIILVIIAQTTILSAIIEKNKEQILKKLFYERTRATVNKHKITSNFSKNNYLSTLQILEDKRSRFIYFFDLPNLCTCVFAFVIGLGLSQTTNAQGVFLPTNLIMGISAIVLVIGLGLTFSSRQWWNAINYSSIRLIPIFWLKKLILLSCYPLSKALLNIVITVMVLGIVVQATPTLVLISVLYCTSFILLFLGIVLNIIRFFCRKNREESFSILLIRCIINIVLTVPSLFIFIVNNDVLWMFPCIFINLLLTIILVITGYKF